MRSLRNLRLNVCFTYNLLQIKFTYNLLQIKSHEKLKEFKTKCRSKSFFYWQNKLKEIKDSLKDPKTFWDKWKNANELDTVQ